MYVSPMLTGAKHLSRSAVWSLAEINHVKKNPPKDLGDAIHRFAAALGGISRIAGLRIRVTGEIPRQPVMLVSNHVSFFDPMVILPTCPAFLVANQHYESLPMVGHLARLHQMFMVKQHEPMHRALAARHMIKAVKAGHSVLNFPEGATSNGSTVLPFWRGSFALAKRLGCPVVPIAIRYDDRVPNWNPSKALIPQIWRSAKMHYINVSLRFGAEMMPRTGEAAESMAVRARNAVDHLLTRNLTKVTAPPAFMTRLVAVADGDRADQIMARNVDLTSVAENTRSFDMPRQR
jgi:lyso-ornithine lipid O-acyltransferase